MHELPLRIVIVGHVDHGKSTLVGRLLHDTDSLPDGKVEYVQEVCKRRGVPFEWAFVMDALQAERNQNVTIDSAQIWFRTLRRPYVFIDAPGHREFLKNMITGAASADVALVLLAADEGVREQSRRHAYLLRMLGIEHIVVLVNKMDLVEWSQDAFEKLVEEYHEVLLQLDLTVQTFIPICARVGSQIVSPDNEHLPWFQGPTVVEALDSFERPPGLADLPLRFPIQDVYRFDSRRIFAGRIEAGTLAVGDELCFGPDEMMSRVRTIETWNGPAKRSAAAGESVGVTLEDPLFLERGVVGTHQAQPAHLTSRFNAGLFWMGKADLVVDKVYRLKLTTQEVDCRICTIEWVIN
ncbi:MAG: sulfate adenylyltransferase subunit 1, partial [Bradymonadaceae bacterium]